MIRYCENFFFNTNLRRTRHANIALSVRLKNWKNPAVSRRFDALGHLRMHARDVNAKQRTRCRYLRAADSSGQHDISRHSKRTRSLSNQPVLFFPPHIVRAGRIDRLINPEASPQLPLRLFYLSLESPRAHTHARSIN